ncbi:MAG: 50S ribosomal protein L25 [Thermoflexales bacterium]|nr:50S ribosomal protein L25 [Thermoflexales bacterium]
MEQIELSVAPRTIKGKEVSGLRRSGVVPAVLYGRHTAPVSLQANGRELMRVLMKAGSSRLVTLNVEGEAAPRMALVREVQREPIRGDLWHVDFYGVSMTEKITLSIRVRFDGVSPAAALNEGVLTYGNDSVEIECLPGDLIDSLVVDLTRLVKVGDVVHVSDLKVPETVKILSNPDDLVVRVTRLAAEEAADAVAAVTSTEPEVIKKGKTDEEGEEE